MVTKFDNVQDHRPLVSANFKMSTVLWAIVSTCHSLANLCFNCSIAVQRGAAITNSFHIKDVLENIELTYMILPPGSSDSAMSRMKLKFSFSGNADGSIDIWLTHRPQKYGGRPDGLYKFGLGVTEVQQGSPNPTIMSFVSTSVSLECIGLVVQPKAREIFTQSNDWVEIELDGENLKGGELQVVILAKYSHRGILSVHLSASTYDEDPKAEEATDDEEVQEFVEHATRRWQSRAYQKEILGQTLEEFLEH